MAACLTSHRKLSHTRSVTYDLPPQEQINVADIQPQQSTSTRDRVTPLDMEEVRGELRKWKQEHLLDRFDTLNKLEQTNLMNEITSMSMAEVIGYFDHTMAETDEDTNKVPVLKPIPQESYGSIDNTPKEELRQYHDVGMDSISNGEVAVLLLAGGQGTRLGVDYPKGMYNMGLPSQKTLYQIQAERIRKLESLAEERTGRKGNIMWYIMTSEATGGKTLQYFCNRNWFGLKKENLVVFEQFMLPCFTMDGKLILDQPYSIARAPDGNGGLYRALRDHNVLVDMESRGIKYLHVYCVDNILVKVADPIFMGFCISKESDCAVKTVTKTDPKEAVGVVCNVNGVNTVMEYSEITQEDAHQRNKDGQLTYRAANTANHFFSLDFLKNVCTEHDWTLKHHIAKKKIPYVDEHGDRIKPTSPNGIKMEKFVFDVIQFAKKFLVWEVQREDEFSPLKNADGAAKDTPTTAREALFNLHARYILQAGGTLLDEDGNPIKPNNCHDNSNTNPPHKHKSEPKPFICELSPLLSYDGEGLESLVKGHSYTSPLHLKARGEKPALVKGMSNKIIGGITEDKVEEVEYTGH